MRPMEGTSNQRQKPKWHLVYYLLAAFDIVTVSGSLYLMALMDLAGKAWGVPCYMLAGGKYRDRVKVYADTPSDPDPENMGKALKGRMDRGFEFLKMDIGVQIAARNEGGVVNKNAIGESQNLMHP